MEEDLDQLVPTTPTRIRTNVTISSTQLTTDIAIPNPNTGNGKIGIPPRGPL